MTRQPKWKFVANLGDADPLEHGGYMVFEDATGVYEAEAEIWDPDFKNLFRIQLDRMALVEGHLIPFRIANRAPHKGPLPHPLKSYIEWFDSHIESVASSNDIAPNELRRLFCSEDPVERAHAYYELYTHEGWINGDSYPVRMSVTKMAKRWKEYL